jgi:hypothetical protein
MIPSTDSISGNDSWPPHIMRVIRSATRPVTLLDRSSPGTLARLFEYETSTENRNLVNAKQRSYGSQQFT